MVGEVKIRGQLRFHDAVALGNAMARFTEAWHRGLSVLTERGLQRRGLLLFVSEEIAIEGGDLFDATVSTVENVARHALSGRVTLTCDGSVRDVEAAGSRAQLPAPPVRAPTPASDDVERMRFALEGRAGYEMRGISRRPAVLGGILWDIFRADLATIEQLGPHIGLMASATSGLPLTFVVDFLRRFASEGRPGLERHDVPVGTFWSADLERLVEPYFEQQADVLAESCRSIRLPLRLGLVWALVRRGALPVDALDARSLSRLEKHAQQARHFQGHGRLSQASDQHGPEPQEIARTVRWIAGLPIEGDLPPMTLAQDEAVTLLTGLGPGAVTAIEETLSLKNTDRRTWLIKALGHMGTSEAANALSGLLSERTKAIRDAAIESLVGLGEGIAGTAIASALSAKGVIKRRAAAEVLARLPTTGWVEAQAESAISQEKREDIRATLTAILGAS